TICTKDRRNLFGEISCDSVALNNIGLIVNNEINNIEKHYTNIKIDKYIIMPNHIHMIITIIEQPCSAGINPCPTIKYDIPNVVGKLKAAVTRNVGNAFMHSENGNIWQSSFNDHIIRGEKDYLKIWEYIDTNVLKWESDCFYCD
ncbi:MAG: transposase, partial [Clostridia bacterium]|nr:transposase [Clostridia bacterium]